MKNIKSKQFHKNKMYDPKKMSNDKYFRPFSRMSFVICFMLLFAGVDLASAQTLTHPCLLFENIEETHGYQHRTESSWSVWEASIISSAENALSKDFTDSTWRMCYQTEAARDLGLAYQITKNTTYAVKAKEALLNLDIADIPYKVSKTWGLHGYSLCYDWVQPYLDTTSDETIRDKLATLADQAYYDLNDGGTNMHYISFADYHGQAYPVMGIVGCVLSDYTNPNSLPLSSMPSDWLKVGIDYLFVNDILHHYNKPLILSGFDEAGKSSGGGYKAYVLDEFLWWFQVYSHFNKRNIFEDYPISKKAFSSELWESLPNRYHNNWCTSGQCRWDYHRVIINLFDNDYKAYMLNHDDLIEDSTLLPYAGEYGANSRLLYLVYDDYSAIPRNNPDWTSHFDGKSFFQVFRENWDEDSDWLSFIVWPSGMETGSNRNMAHHDQLSFEYYSKGDLLLADGGEIKYVFDNIYGEYGIYHNAVLIEDPRNPFNVSSWANSTARGIYKGDASSLITPAYIENSIQTLWMELLDTNTTIENVIGSSWSSKQSLTSAIECKRIILYPDKDYFIIIDRLEGSELWIYRNVFRPTSLSITPSTGTAESEVGHINGNLTIGGIPYDWLSLSYKNETATGISTSSIKWNTTNPYGNEVELHLFSNPSSEIRVTKHLTRIAGTGRKSEVFLPVVYFRVGKPANDLYRVTVLLSGYTTETERTPEEVSVTGNGNAIKVTSSTYEDYIYAGNGESSFGELTTDVDILYFRKATKPLTLTFIRGSYIDYGEGFFQFSNEVDYLTANYEDAQITFIAKGLGGMDIRLKVASVSSVTKDGAGVGFSQESGILLIPTVLNGEHKFVISLGPPPSPSPQEDLINKITISPNPYIAGQGSGEKIVFSTLPKKVTIRIYTIAGKLVKTISHKDTADGSSAEWDISGIASGIYIYYIESPQGKKKGKVSIVK